MIPPLRHRGQIVRTIAVGDDLAITVDDAPGAYFACAHREPSDKRAGGAPRDRVPGSLHFHSGLTLSPGARVEIDGTTLELIGPVDPQRSGTTLLGYRADVLPLSVLYPRQAALQELGGAVVSAAIPCALWQPRERDTDRGNYADYVAEAPVEHAAVLSEPNRQLAFGAATFKIGRALIDYELPRVELELTRG